jgi:hypothetical protein
MEISVISFFGNLNIPHISGQGEGRGQKTSILPGDPLWVTPRVEKGNLNIAYIELALVVTCFSIKKRLNIHQLRRILLQFVVHIRFLQ